ncbi:tetratricopeptide repeat protein [Pseudoflavitalea sp. X16]|uniref:tetratricopeptide repeat protein n=1 Tax=Paraflavitalea devenefica TaxID=2716334 RepID=UPI0014204FB0|nr:tetratricopeptide repeat protein [Paraflavitalea devenefica]NII29507.1 tetratricopeptide repeat protein [Paraflavitalea devenefica]
MKIIFFSLLLLVAAGCGVSAQQSLIQPFIKAWKVTDTSQSARAQVLYDTLHLKKDTARYEQVIEQLYQYLQEHPDKRLEARTILYQTLGALEFNYTIDNYIGRMQKAIRLAGEIGDDQLAAEIYSVYAGIGGPENYLLYNLKAVELQRRVGLHHFFFVYTRFFDLSRALYLNHDYRQSIAYGLECLHTPVTDRDHYDPLVYVFQLDILGACYKKLGQYDSAVYYYENLLRHVPGAIPHDVRKQQLWMGIGKGNLGHLLILQGKYDEALPLVETYFKSSVDYDDQLNMAMALNYLGSIYAHKKQYTQALTAWRQAYYWSRQSGSVDNAVQAAQGIAGIFRLTGPTDSAYHYYELYHQHKDSLAATLSQLQLSGMKARIAFDELQASLGRSQAALQKERSTRNIIIAAIAFIALIALWLYNRYRLKQKYALQSIRQQQEVAGQEIKSAREQIASFTSHLIEKNNLIETLEAQISSLDQQQDPQAIAISLQQYTLLTDTEWEKFKVELAKAYPDFLTTLRQQIPQITPAEERLATLLFLRLNTYQIASALGIGKESVLRSKRRLKQRLQLPEPVTVEEYLFNLLSTNM